MRCNSFCVGEARLTRKETEAPPVGFRRCSDDVSRGRSQQKGCRINVNCSNGAYSMNMTGQTLIVSALCFVMAGQLCGQTAEVTKTDSPVATPSPTPSALVHLDQLDPPILPPPQQPSESISEGEMLKAWQAAASLSQRPPADEAAIAQAVDTVTTFLKKNPDVMGLHFALARWHVSKKQYQLAITDLRTALKCSQAAVESPQAAESLLLLARLLKRQGHYLAALECYRELSRRIDAHGREFKDSPSIGLRMLRPELNLNDQGEILAKLNRPVEAADVLRKAFRYDRSNRKTARLLGESLIAAKRFDQAEALLLEMATLEEHDTRIAAFAEQLARTTRDSAMPARMLEILLKRKQMNATLAVVLAKIADDFGDRGQAIRILEAYLAVEPGNVQAGSELVSMYAADQRFHDALLRLVHILSADPTAVELVRDGVARIIAGPTPVDIELQFAVKAQSLKNDDQFDTAALYFVAAQLAEQRGVPRVAEKLYRSSIAAKGDYAPAYEAILDLYALSGNSEQIARTLNQAATLGEKHYLEPYLQGRILLGQDRFAQAAKQLERARLANPSHLSTLLMLGEAYGRLSQNQQATKILGQAIRLDPSNEKTYQLLFDIYSIRGQWRQATQVARALRQRRPDSHAGIIMMARLAIYSGNTDLARRQLETLRKGKADPTEIRILEIQFELADGKDPLPEKDFQAKADELIAFVAAEPYRMAPKVALMQLIVRQGPEATAAAVSIWGDLYTRTSGELSVARTYVDALIRSDNNLRAAEVLTGIVDNDTSDLGSLRALLQILMKLDKTDEAARRCLAAQKVLDDLIASSQDPAAVESYRRQKMQFYIIAGLKDQLAEFVAEWIKLKPNDESIKRVLIATLSEAGQNDKAHRFLDEWASDSAERADEYRQIRLALYAKSKQTEKSLALLREWITDKPDLLAPRQMIIGTLASEKRFDEAILLLDEWIESLTAPAATQPTTMPTTAPVFATQPADAPADSELAKWARQTVIPLLMIQHQYDRALDRLNIYASMDSDNGQLLMMRSTCLAELGRSDEALIDMEAAHRIDPSNPLLNNNFGYMLADAGIRLDQAERFVRQALADQPKQISFQDSLAWVFYKQGKIAVAARVLTEAMASHPEQTNQTVVYDHAGDTVWRLGQKVQAIEYWQKAVELAEAQDYKALEVRNVLINTPLKISAAQANQAPPVAPLGKGVELESEAIQP